MPEVDFGKNGGMHLARSWLHRIRAEQRARSLIERSKTDRIDAGGPHGPATRPGVAAPAAAGGHVLHYYLELDVREVAETMRASRGP